MSLVNLFIVGAPKSGTSSLAELFSNNYAIFSPKIKEPAYFCEDKRNNSISLHKGKNFYFPIDSLEKYQKLYESNDYYKYKLDASVDYFDSYSAAQNISIYNPQSKIIICLRNHESYLKSLYSEMIKSAGEEVNNFATNILLRPEERKQLPKFLRSLMDIDYKHRLKFSEMISNYYKHFPSKNILIIDFNELISKSTKLEVLLSNFLELDISLNDLKHINRKKNIQNQLVINVISRLRQTKIKKMFPNILKKKINEIILNFSTLKLLSNQKLNFENIILPEEINTIIESDIESLKDYDFIFKK